MRRQLCRRHAALVARVAESTLDGTLLIAPLRLLQVVFTDEMAVDPVGVIKDVLDFLGLDFTSDDESKV